MRTVHLHGELAERFGAEWRLDVASPAEAFRAIEANRPGFAAYLLESDQRGVGYRVIAGDLDLEVEQLKEPYGQEVLHLVPVIGGAKDGMVGIIIGAIAIVGAFFTAGMSLTLLGATFSVSSILVNIGLSLVLGGVAQMLVGDPKDPVSTATTVEEKRSYFFNGPANTVAEGNPVPVGYGRLIVGGKPISAGITAEAF